MIGRTNCTQKSGSPSEFVNIQMLTNQAEHSNLNGAVLTMSYETYSKQYTWDGSEITFSVPAHVSCTIEFPSVEGYKKPDNITFVAVEGNSRTIEAEYKAELVKVNVTSSNGSAVSGATLTINGKQHPWNGTEIRQLVPFGTQYSVVAGAVSGFGTPSTQTFTAQNPEREVSVVYIASSLKVNILSNQGTDAAITNVKATVTYGDTSVEVANGGTVNLPTNVSVTISFPEVADYKKPNDITFTHNGGLVEKSGTYKCELLAVNVSADSGTPAGFEVTIGKQEVVGIATKYTKLEYIEASGTQWVDTGFTPNNNTRMVLDFAATNTGTGSLNTNNIIGSRETTTAKAFAFSTVDGYWRMGYNNSSTKTSVQADTLRHVADFNKNVLKLDNTTIHTVTSATFTGYGSIYIGAIHASSKYVGYVKVYSCQIYDNGALVRDFVPAKRSDGMLGLYDSVSDAFYPSSGTGDFVSEDSGVDIIAVQTSVTGSYKIPFDTSYTVKSNKVNGYDTPANVSRIASTKSYTVNQEYTVITVKDLSLYDVYGNRINRSTANCYVIREAGQYKFPLVYGNAIKNGKVNTAAFTNNGGSYSHDFVDGFGNTITQPYINTSGGDMAHLLQYDCENAISNLSIIDGDECKYVQFDVTSIPSNGGNAIIEFFPGNEGTSWSWHIWLWPHDLTPVEITNSTGVKYNIMPVNLASKYDSDGVHIKNWFYQWGRPNPMLLPSAWNSTTDHTPGSITKASKASSLATGLNNPSTFYYNSSSPYNWFGTKSYYNLWDAACTGTGASDNDTVKTVYDPCPVGWKVPNGNTFTGLSVIRHVKDFVYMRRYSTDNTGIGFPISGNRSAINGSLVVSSSGYLWTSSSSASDLVRYFTYNTNSINVVDNARAFGLSIRPVQDDLTKIDTI